MPEDIEIMGGPRVSERSFGGWRIVASAWVVAVVIVMLFAGVQAFASRHGVSPRQENFAGVVIPRHDPSCAGAGELTNALPPSCQGDVQSALERAEASYYGW
jgi:hypothetical protein